jgi:hypothetical protein
MKRCYKCNEVKPFTEFHNNRSTKDGYTFECRACRNKICKAYRDANKKKILKQARAIRLEKKKRAVDYKGGKCGICDGVFSAHVYDFHHIDPATKESGVAALINQNRPWNIIKAELDKCTLLCANCHRDIEYQAGEEI